MVPRVNSMSTHMCVCIFSVGSKQYSSTPILPLPVIWTSSLRRFSFLSIYITFSFHILNILPTPKTLSPTPSSCLFSAHLVFLQQKAHTLQISPEVLIAEQCLCLPHPHQLILPSTKKLLQLLSLPQMKTYMRRKNKHIHLINKVLEPSDRLRPTQVKKTSHNSPDSH